MGTGLVNWKGHWALAPPPSPLKNGLRQLPQGSYWRGPFQWTAGTQHCWALVCGGLCGGQRMTQRVTSFLRPSAGPSLVLSVPEAELDVQLSLPRPQLVMGPKQERNLRKMRDVQGPWTPCHLPLAPSGPLVSPGFPQVM